jgi:hypothetical protein
MNRARNFLGEIREAFLADKIARSVADLHISALLLIII